MFELGAGAVTGLVIGIMIAAGSEQSKSHDYLIKIGAARYSAVDGRFIKDSAVVRGDTILMIRKEK